MRSLLRIVFFVWLLLTVLLVADLARAQEIKRPTAEADAGAVAAFGCSGTNSASGTMPNFYDASGQSTSSSLTGAGSTTTTFYKTRKFTSWQTTGNTYSALTLNVNVSTASGGVGGGLMGIVYSTNSGGSWTSITSASDFTQQTFTVSLSAAQDLSTLQVGVCVEGESGGGVLGDFGSETVTGFDIWTSGTTSGGGGGAGSGNGTGKARRGSVAP